MPGTMNFEELYAVIEKDVKVIFSKDATVGLLLLFSLNETSR